MEVFDIGEQVELAAIAKNRKSGEPASPADYYFKVLPPKGDAVKPSVTSGAAGEYSAIFEPTTNGTHHYLFLAKSGDKVAGEGKIKVRKPGVPRD